MVLYYVTLDSSVIIVPTNIWDKQYNPTKVFLDIDYCKDMTHLLPACNRYIQQP